MPRGYVIRSGVRLENANMPKYLRALNSKITWCKDNKKPRHVILNEYKRKLASKNRTRRIKKNYYANP